MDALARRHRARPPRRGKFLLHGVPLHLRARHRAKVPPRRFTWPRALRSKWIAVGLLVVYFWAYEAFDLWDNPAATSGVFILYFLGALLIDGFFKDASFCKYVCPVGQFHFVQSLVSPLQVRVREPDVCASCRTYDCIKGNATQRGCELKLFQPRKAGNMDCTFCLDCIKACPHDNVGILATPIATDLSIDLPRSSVGRYGKRVDLASLVLVLTFGAFANAAGMVVPVLNWLDALNKQLGLSTDHLPTAVLGILSLVVLPALLATWAAALSRKQFGLTQRETFSRFSMALAPLGFGMWVAHFTFHFFTGALTPVPVIHRVLRDLGLPMARCSGPCRRGPFTTCPRWSWRSSVSGSSPRSTSSGGSPPRCGLRGRFSVSCPGGSSQSPFTSPGSGLSSNRCKCAAP